MTADFIEFADDITMLRQRVPPAATPAPTPAPPTTTATNFGDTPTTYATGEESKASGGHGNEERVKRKKTAGDFIESVGSELEQEPGRRRTARTAGGGGGGGGGRGSETERTLRKRVRTAGNVGGKRRTKTAGDVSDVGGGGDGQAASGQDEQKATVVAATDTAVGTVVFNSVFGNLWDQGAALDRAASILEVCCAGVVGEWTKIYHGLCCSKMKQTPTHVVDQLKRHVSCEIEDFVETRFSQAACPPQPPPYTLTSTPAVPPP